MTYETPNPPSGFSYHGSAYASANNGGMYYADIGIDFTLSVYGAAVAGPHLEDFADPNFQSFLDHVSSWEGFQLAGPDYTEITETTVYGSKSWSAGQEITPTEEPS